MRGRHTAKLLWVALLAMAAFTPATVAAAAEPGPESERLAVFEAPADPDAPRIVGLDVQPVARLVPGVALRFELRGTPGAEASLRIGGARKSLGLAEVSPGHYRGVYTVGLGDRIAPDASIVGNLRRGDRQGIALSSEPLQRTARAPA